MDGLRVLIGNRSRYPGDGLCNVVDQMIREGVVRTLLYLYDEHDVVEQTLVRSTRSGDARPEDQRYHDYLEALTLFAMSLATDAEVDAAYAQHAGLAWL